MGTMSKSNLDTLLQIKNSTETSVDLYIYGDIVSSEDWAWDDEDTYPSQIREFLDEANGRDVNVYINSGGGSAFAGFAIASMLRRYEGTTRSYIDGVCASISTIIALSCDETYIANGASWMHHQSWGACYAVGIAKEIVDAAKEYSKALTAINESMLSIYKSKLADSDDAETIEKQMATGRDTWLTADEVVSFFDVQMVEGKQAVAYAETEVFDAKSAPESVQKLMRQRSEENLAKQTTDLKAKYLFDF